MRPDKFPSTKLKDDVIRKPQSEDARELLGMQMWYNTV